MTSGLLQVGACASRLLVMLVMPCVRTCMWGARLATSCLQASMTAAAVDSLPVLLQVGPVHACQASQQP